jgi:hypothetical protein
MKKRDNTKIQEAQKERALMKKEVTPKCKGLKSNTFNKKRGNPKMQGAKKRPPMKKEATPKCKGLKKKYLR